MGEVISSYRASDGKNISYRSWAGSESKSRTSGVPCIIFIHGIESHSAWFSEAGDKLAGYGLEVFALDRRGSGLNKEDRGDIEDFNLFISDIEDFFLQKRLSGKRCVLAGVCWGAKPVLYFSILHPDMVARIMFLTPGFKTRLNVPLLEKMRWLWALIFSPRTTLNLPIEPGMFTEDEAYLEKIRDDELRLKKITGRFFKENIRLERAIKKRNEKLDIPCHLFLAEKDEILDNNKVIAFLERYFKNFELITYKGVRHGILFEPCREEVIENMASRALRE